MITIKTGDFRVLSKSIPDDSVDLILADPVYDRLDDYRDLSMLASRILKPGGNCIAQSGSYYIALNLMAMSEHLDYVWTLAEVYPFATSRQFDRRVVQGWKAHLWFSKGKRIGEWIIDRYRGGGRDKRNHKWGDSVAFYQILIAKLTEPDAMIYDPFVGGGTVPAASYRLGRNCIGHEIDPEAADIARKRLAETQPPLFVLPPAQQLELPVPNLEAT